jgi:uncharacterized OsmC-like protein
MHSSLLLEGRSSLEFVSHASNSKLAKMLDMRSRLITHQVSARKRTAVGLRVRYDLAPMDISAQVISKKGDHKVAVRTNGREQSLTIPPKPDGLGSSANGGELLFLALATCYCNDIYREAKKRGIEIRSVEVEVTGEFGGEGEPARSIMYKASVAASAPQEKILALMRYTDSVAEIQNTLRCSPPIVLSECEAREE